MQNHPTRRGMTLVEVVVSTLLAGLVLVCALRGVGSIFATWRESEDQHDGEGLAEQLMTEILQQLYEEPDDPPVLGVESPEVTTARSDWDDVDDYNGWSSAPETKDGTALSGWSGWSRAVTVEYVTIADPTTTTGSDEGLKRVTVTVTDPDARQTVLVAFRSQWGALEKLPLGDTTAQTFVTHEMQIGTSTTIQRGVALQNHAQDD